MLHKDKISWDDLTHHPLFKAMELNVENSPWHREANTLVHTQMVLEQLNLSAFSLSSDLYNIAWFSCAFHDVGKPAAAKPNGKGYNSFHGHEAYSANMFLDYAIENNIGFSASEMAAIHIIISNHLPYCLPFERVAAIIHTLSVLLNESHDAIYNMFKCVVLSDAGGRISDDPESYSKSAKWFDDLYSRGIITTAKNIQNKLNSSAKEIVYLVGVSGAGKSTISKGMDDSFAIISMDGLKWDFAREHEILGVNETSKIDSAKAFAFSIKGELEVNGSKFEQPEITFDQYAVRRRQALKDEQFICVDATNLSPKVRRRNFSPAGRNAKAVVFLVSLSTAIESQKPRAAVQRPTPLFAIKDQFYALRIPLIGEEVTELQFVTR